MWSSCARPRRLTAGAPRSARPCARVVVPVNATRDRTDARWRLGGIMHKIRSWERVDLGIAGLILVSLVGCSAPDRSPEESRTSGGSQALVGVEESPGATELLANLRARFSHVVVSDDDKRGGRRATKHSVSPLTPGSKEALDRAVRVSASRSLFVQSMADRQGVEENARALTTFDLSAASEFALAEGSGRASVSGRLEGLGECQSRCRLLLKATSAASLRRWSPGFASG